MITPPSAILVDATNVATYAPVLKAALAKDALIAIDVETEDSAKHAGLRKIRKLVIDHRRNRLCGVSLYSDSMGDRVYYINVGHADVANRITRAQLLDILEAKPAGAWWIAHNAPFEITAFASTIGWDIGPEIICTLQLAVTAHGPTEFLHTDWTTVGQGAIGRLVPQLMRMSMNGLTEDEDGRQVMSPELSEFVGKILAKSSKAEHSYNGLIKSIALGYGLKGLVRRLFGYEMTTYAEVLKQAGIVAKAAQHDEDEDDDQADDVELTEEFGAAEHMGELTGAQVVDYGADDAFWAHTLFKELVARIQRDNPGDDGAALLDTFFTQENPMCQVFSGIARGGMRVNFAAIGERRAVEREETAKILREMKSAVRALLPFADEPSQQLIDYDTSAQWYTKGFKKYRDKITAWAESEDSDDAFGQVIQCNGAVTTGWCDERGVNAKKLQGPNFTHYMPMRVVLYDLIGAKRVIKDGKIQSNGETRGKILDKLEDDDAKKVVRCINQLAGVEQRMKLYLTPYMRLTDPDTTRLYPTVTSMLATRRLGCNDPNAMQLAKRGASTYVRGFFLADTPEHGIASLDWSSIELVEVAEFSGDPVFCSAYAQLPHQDLHAGAAADVLSAEVTDLTEASFLALKRIGEDDAKHLHPRLITDIKGQALPHDKIFKYWRTTVGKPSNFGYWYSGSLFTIAETMGWSGNTMNVAVDRYRERFAVAEAWRVATIAEVAENGFITLPDHHRYVRYEATAQWQAEFCAKFMPGFRDASTRNYEQVIRIMARKLARRAGNQTVNAMIQGSCATLAKRSILRIQAACKARGWGDEDVRFLMPIHDELLFSVRWTIMAEFLELARSIMITHPDMFTRCKLDSSPAIGVTFEPWSTKTPLGQVELFEPPAEIVGKEREGKRLDRAGVEDVIAYLRDRAGHEMRMAA